MDIRERRQTTGHTVVIRQFLAWYAEAGTFDEEALAQIADLLADFIVHEQWYRSRDDAAAALGFIDEISRRYPDTIDLCLRARHAVRGLAGKLARSEDAVHILREEVGSIIGLDR